jgi:Icc-related predicted phosphoesterase
MTSPSDTLRIAAVGDIHCTTKSQGQLKPLFEAASSQADVLLLCGDLTDYGLPEEADVLVAELSTTKIPTLAVFGNHDYESGQQEQVRQILTQAGVKLLDGESCEIAGVGFAGVKGFAGGFGSKMLQAWGEASIKALVHEAVEEALKLESALAKLTTPQRVAVLHYAPIQATVEGEPSEIYPFLGSSRLEEPLSRYGVAAAFHGHAHNGHLEGQTSSQIPVYNVSMPLLKKHRPEQPPFLLWQVDVTPRRPAPPRP